MSDTLTLNASARGAKAADVRNNGQVPCVVYGNKTENTSIAVSANELLKVFRKAGESTVVELDIDGKKMPVLFHAWQEDPISSQFIHVDFFAVDMNKKVEANIPVVFTGVSPAVKDLGGVLVTSNDTVSVSCLPANLPHELEVSLETLVDFETTLTAASVIVPANVELLDDESLVIATVQQPRAAVEETEAVAAEGEEGEEGAEGVEGEGGDSE